MATEVFSIKGTLDLDSKAYEKGLTSASRKTQSFGGMLKDAEKGSFALLGGIAALGAGALGLATKAAFTAARTETLGVAMLAVAKSTGTSIQALKAQEEALKDQGITTQESRRILIRFMQSNLDLADATKIARVAQDLAVISGTNSSVMTARLTDAISTMNPELLKSVGITLTSKQVFDKYAKTLGKSGDALTETEKKQALLNLILERGKDVAGAYEDSMDTVGKKMGSLARLFEEAFNVIGEMFLPILGDVVDALSEFLKKINVENIEKFIDKIKESRDVLIPLAFAIMFGLVPALFAMAGGFWAATRPLIPFLVVGALVGFVVAAIIEHFGGLEETLKAFEPTIEKVKEVFSDFWSVLTEQILPALSDLWDSVKVKLVPALEDLWNFINDSVVPVLWEIWGVVDEHIIPALTDLWETIKNDLLPALQELWNEVKPILIPALQILAFIFLVLLFGAIMATIQGVKMLSQMFALIASVITFAIGVIKTQIISVIEGLQGFINFLSELPATVGGIINLVIDWFKKLPESIGFAIGRSLRILFNFASRLNNFFTKTIPRSIRTTIAWFRTLPGRIGSALSSMWRTVRAWFGRTIKTSKTSGSKAVSGFLSFFKGLPGKIAGIFGRVVDVIKGWGPKLWQKAKNIAGSFWSGFKKGLGFGSPSFIERAFADIAKQSSKTLDQVSADITKFNNIAGRVADSPALRGVGDITNTNSITTNISGPINIGTEVQADNFLERLSRNTELAGMGLTTDNGK